MDHADHSESEDSYERRMRKKERKKRRKEEKHGKKKKREMDEEQAASMSPQKDEPANVNDDSSEQSLNSTKRDKKSQKKLKKESSELIREDRSPSNDSATQEGVPISTEENEKHDAQSENTMSTREPKYIGVNKHKIHGYYETKIIVNKKVHFIGNFASADEAAHAYDKKALELKGPVAKTNFDKHGNRIEQPHSSKYVGVALHKDRTKFKAYIRGTDGKIIHLGVFEDEKEAALAYDQAARELRGSSAKTNFPPI